MKRRDVHGANGAGLERVRGDLYRDLGRLILADLPEEKLLREVADRLITAADADGGFLIAADPAAPEGFAVLAARSYRKADIRRPEFEVSRTLVRDTLAGGDPLLFSDAVGAGGRGASRSLRELRILSAMVLPVRRDAPLPSWALVYLDRRRPGREFRRADLDVLREVLEWANPAIAHAFESRRQRGAAPAGGAAMEGLVGDSPATLEVAAFIRKAAASAATVLIRGETGTGKELVAQLLHRHGAPADSPFVAINCAAIPPELLESELFGHEAGAYTGAQRARAGRFLEAGAGTLFLDEIGDMPPALQAKLLRVIESRRIPVVGGGERPFRARLVAATHQPLHKLIAAGKFRQDLYYRLAVLEVTLAPLARRREEIPALATHFLALHARRLNRLPPRLSPGALRHLQRRAWPGNVRELAHLMERAVIFHPGPVLQPADLRESVAAAEAVPGLPSTATELRARRQQLVDALDRDFLEQLLLAHRGNVTAAAAAAGFTRARLYQLLRRHLPDAAR